MLKLITRTIRNFFITKPYYAHLTLTHKCNIKCTYCQLWKNDTKELSTRQYKKIIDILDKLGIAILVFHGGEPLLRDDVFELINYAKNKGIYTRIVSNGLMPRESYKRLLETKIDMISISLDGIEGNKLPYQKTSPKILNTIRYFYKKKKLSIITVLTNENKNKMQELLNYMKSNFPKLPISIHPVMSGIGKLRTNTEKVDPTILRKLKHHFDPKFFINACIKYYKKDRFNWHCKAGKLFMEIAPDGEFWLCHDISTNLNILDNDFMQKYKSFNFKKLRNNCVGCTYSCHYITQKMFELKHLPDIIKMYFKVLR
jgi:MoaA/NifB/PqqE/SkfB family radical SAM enzyme